MNRQEKDFFYFDEKCFRNCVQTKIADMSSLALRVSKMFAAREFTSVVRTFIQKWPPMDVYLSNFHFSFIVETKTAFLGTSSLKQIL